MRVRDLARRRHCWTRGGFGLDENIRAAIRSPTAGPATTRKAPERRRDGKKTRASYTVLGISRDGGAREREQEETREMASGYGKGKPDLLKTRIDRPVRRRHDENTIVTAVTSSGVSGDCRTTSLSVVMTKIQNETNRQQCRCLFIIIIKSIIKNVTYS